MKQQLPWFLGLVCCCLLAAGIQAQTPVASYSFSGSANDGSTFANHAAVNGASLTTDRFGISNRAMAFDGVQGSATAPNASRLNSPNTTISFWVNPAAFPAQGEVYILSHGGWQERWKISMPSHGKPVFTTHSNGACCSDMDSGKPLELNKWTHVVMVHDGAKDIIYFNGEKVNEKNVTGALDSTKYPLGIGFDPIDNGNYFKGSLDEVMLFDKALTAAEITALYTAQNTAPAAARAKVAGYSFSGNGVDNTPFANHATIKDGTMTADRFGYGNAGLKTNGTSTAVTAPNSAQLNTPFTTISFWINPKSFPGSGEVFLLSHGGWQERWKISMPSHGKPVFTTHSNGACCSDMDSGTPLNLNKWTHVVMVHDGAKDVIYFNGAKVNEKNVTGNLDTTKYALGIGWNPIDSGGWFDGKLDEVEIYNYAFTAAEVTALYTAQSTFPGTATDLVAEYKLNGEGTDNTQFANHAVLSASAVGASNRHGWGSNALRGAATAENSAALQSDFTTISFWVNPKTFPGSGEVYLLSNGGWQERWKISMPSHGKPVFTTNSNGACCSDMDSGKPLELNKWTHVVMVHDGAKDIIYFNGEKVNEKNVTGALGKTVHPFGIGYDPIDKGSFFDGALDDIQIYSKALTATEIAALYAAQNPAPAVSGDLVANYTFQGNSMDQTSYSNHASPAKFGKDRFGKANRSASFDGKTEVQAANSPQLNTPLATVSFWVKPNTFPGNGESFLLSFGGWQERWKISVPSHGKPVWTTNHSNGISDMDSGKPLDLGKWTHVVMVHDGAKDLIYFNGGKVAEKAVVGTLDNTTFPLGIGYNPIDGGNWFDGDLDEVQIYKVALDSAQILALYNAQAQAPTGGDTIPPTAPLSLAAAVMFNNVTLSWLPASDNQGVTAYNIYIDDKAAATTTGTSQAFNQLNPLTKYKFSVTALDAAGNESLPTSLNVTTGADQAPDTIPPSKPANLRASPSFNSILLSWDASTDNTQVAGYYVWVDGDILDTLLANELSILIRDLSPETAYSFEVAAFDQAKNQSAIAELTVSTTKPLDTGEPGLVAHYPFDGNANDATPYQNHGVIGGNPTFIPANRPGAMGQAIVFDGDRDSVLAPNAVQLLSDFTTVSFWIRVDKMNTADPEAYVMDFGHWDQRWKISLPQHRKIVWTTNSKNNQFPNFISDMDSGDGNDLPIGVWSYITMVHDGKNDIIYKDGVKVNTKPAEGKLNSTNRPLGFGNNPIEGKQYFNGALDNVKIYNKALTEAEALKLFTGGTTDTYEPNLVDSYVDPIFPNPVSDILQVRHRLPSNEALLVRVFDIQGRQVDALRLTQGDVATGQFSVDVARLPQGIYSLNFVMGGKNLGSMRFTKK